LSGSIFDFELRILDWRRDATRRFNPQSQIQNQKCRARIDPIFDFGFAIAD
jgi:hypothetical protein